MGVKKFIWDELSDNVLLETDENDMVTAAYTNRPERFGELLSQHRSGVDRFFHFDGKHSTSDLTACNEKVTDTFSFTAYGEEVARTGTTTTPFGFKGAVGYYTNEATNDLYVRAETYEPALGCWLSRDLAGFIEGANLYKAYSVIYNATELSFWKIDVDPNPPIGGFDDYDFAVACDSVIKVWAKLVPPKGGWYFSFYLEVWGESDDCCSFSTFGYDIDDCRTGNNSPFGQTCGGIYDIFTTVRFATRRGATCDPCCSKGQMTCITYEVNYEARFFLAFEAAYGTNEITICPDGTYAIDYSAGAVLIDFEYYPLISSSGVLAQKTCPRISVN